MNTLREAAQQALEAMDKATRFMRDSDYVKLNQAVDALRAALAQQEREQEPVAWQWLNSAYFRRKPPANAESGAWNPLYAASPRREWQSLTNEEIYPLYNEPRSDAEMLEFARAVEQALKEKNT